MPTNVSGSGETKLLRKVFFWTSAVVPGMALAMSSTVWVLHIPPFSVTGFCVLSVAGILGVLLAGAIARRVIRPAWLKWSRSTRFGVVSASVLLTAFVGVLLSSDAPLNVTWRWAVGPQVGRAVVSKTQVSWGQAVPSVLEFNVSAWPGTPDPEWAWRMTSDLPGRLGRVRSRIGFRVTQPEGQVFNLNNGGQWEQFRGSDGVTVNFKAEHGRTSERVGQIALNLHALPEQRRWHVVQVDVPASSDSLAIEVDSGANHKGDTVDVSVERVQVRLLGTWVDVGQAMGVINTLALLWLALVVSVLTIVALDALPAVNARMSRWPGAGGAAPVVPLLATLLVMAAAWVGTSTVLTLLGWQRATWVSVDVNADDASLPPPYVYINHTGAVGDFQPVLWNDWRAGWTVIGIRPVSNGQSVKVLAIENEQKQVIPPGAWRLASSGMTLLGAPQTLLVSSPGALWLPNSPYPSRLTLVFEAGPGAGRVELEWLGQRHEFDLSSPTVAVYRAEISKSVTYQGWLLLPPNEIDDIRVSFGNRDARYALHDLTVYGASPQTWTGSTLVAAGVTSAAGCRLVQQADDMSVEREPGAGCAVRLPNLRPVNAVPVYLRLLVWASMTGVTLAVLWGLSIASRLSRRWGQRYQVVEGWPMDRLRRWTANWPVGRVAAIVGIATVVFQLLYLIAIPIGYINDTHGYYKLAQNFLNVRSFYAIDPIRTPGYPGFIAFTIWLFGNQMEGIVLLQHLLLAALGPVTVWFLYPRVGPLFAAIGGMLVGLGPTASLLANWVSTESLFTTLSYLSLVCVIQYRTRPSGAFLAGLLAGLATLVRPNGILIPAIMLAWLFVWWWCGQERITAFRRLVPVGVALSLGCLLLVTPWLLAEHGMTGQWELDHQSPFTLWYNSVIEGRASANLAINRPLAVIFRYSSLAQTCNEGEGWRPQEDLAFARQVDYPFLSNPADSTFFAETFREGLRENPRRFLQFLVPSLRYDLFHILPGAGSPLCVQDAGNSEVYYGKFSYPLQVPSSTSDPRNLGALLKEFSYRWHPPQSRLRTAILRFTRDGIDAWGVVAAFALASLMACLMFKPIRDLTLLWLYWMVSVALLGVMGFPVDRYLFVLESLVCLMAMVMVYALLAMRLRR
jgi:hypothetical protein